MNNITEEMVDSFNAEMFKRGSLYRVIKGNGTAYSYDITLPTDPFERGRPMLYPNGDFYKLLEDHFNEYGVDLSYNNTASTFWSIGE